MIRFDNDFIQRHARPRGRRETPILFFHSLDAAGRVELQGYIFELLPDGTGRARLFEWLLGQPEEQALHFTKAFLESCHFYTADREWRACAPERVAL